MTMVDAFEGLIIATDPLRTESAEYVVATALWRRILDAQTAPTQLAAAPPSSGRRTYWLLACRGDAGGIRVQPSPKEILHAD